jgi:hypothetical protein
MMLRNTIAGQNQLTEPAGRLEDFCSPSPAATFSMKAIDLGHSQIQLSHSTGISLFPTTAVNGG